MGIKYFIGKTFSTFLDFILKHDILNVSRFFPMGHHHHNDLRKILGNSDLVIFDIGANIGNTVLNFKTFFKESTIYCFEPISDTYDILKYKIRKQKKVLPFCLAFGEKEEEITIQIQKDSETNSLLNITNCNDTKNQKVKVLRLDQFCIEKNIFKIDILKIDVEGFEIQVLNGCGDFLKNSVKAIYIEVGFVENDSKKTNFKTVDQYLFRNNFVLVGYYENFRWGDKKEKLGFANALYLKVV